MHIAIAGNIGAGKTTLARMLAKHYNWRAHFDDADDNPYINDFYQDMSRWSFNMQIYYLNKRLSDVLDIRRSGETVVQDRTIYEDVHIFSPTLLGMDLMDVRDFENFTGLFNILSAFVAPPDLLIYLRASVPTLVFQIQNRERQYERSINIDYLMRLNQRYEEWFKTYNQGKSLVIDINKLNFPKSQQDFSIVIDRIDAELHGLF